MIKMKQSRLIIRRILLVVVGLILGCNVYFSNAGTLLGNTLPMPFGYGLANVLSGSMEPTFSKGALLIVKDTKDVKVGDIVVYQSQSELIVHRIVSLNKNVVVTQGDANNVSDVPFDKSLIRGKVICWIPFLGGFVSILKNPIVGILILILAFVLMEKSFQKQRDVDDEELEKIKEEIRRLKKEK